jgi:malate dehydrogenase (oxaloacetate-decarboxylating)(NADP+)
VLVGRPAVIEQRIASFVLRMRPGQDFEVVNPASVRRFRD